MKWVTVWGNAPSITEHRAETYAKDITLRYPVTCAFGGQKVRLHFSNFCGTEPVTLTRVTLARAMGDREISLHNARLVTFGGEESVTIPAGVAAIGAYAFAGCDSLETVAFAEGSALTVIYARAFYNCGELSSVGLPEWMTAFGS